MSFRFEKIISEREATHGRWARTAEVAQAIKRVIASHRYGSGLSPMQAEALEGIAVKIARILCGDAGHPEYWRDIVGYAILGSEGCLEPEKANEQTSPQ